MTLVRRRTFKWLGAMADDRFVHPAGDINQNLLYECFMEANLFTLIFAVLFFLGEGFELMLDILQLRYLLHRPDTVPKHLEGKVDLETIRNAVAYHKDKLKLRIIVRFHGAGTIWFMILFGFNFLDMQIVPLAGSPVLGALLFFGILALAGAFWDLPLELVSTFVVEQRHGFNRQTFREFMTDKLKEIIVSLIIGTILLTALLLLMARSGQLWWVYAFLTVASIQVLILWIYPVLIMPLFNRFEPVVSDLANDVAAMARKIEFPLRGVMSMDGSKRSSHSNAFFIGFGRSRRIVLYDTLIEHLERTPLLSVVAHELGHFKLGHLKRRVVLMVSALLILLLVLAELKDITALHYGLGFSRMTLHSALIVFGLLISELSTPAGWLMRILSRADEYAADKFAVQLIGSGEPLSDALIGLTKQNLSSPGAHPLYRSYYNSHPSLRERLAAIKSQ